MGDKAVKTGGRSANGKLRVGLWVLLGFAVVLGLGWLGESNPLLGASETVVVAGEGQTPRSEAMVVDMFSPGGYLATALIPSSADHVASATHNGHTTELFAYQSNFEDRGLVQCSLEVSATGGGGGCKGDSQPGPKFGGGSGGSGPVGEPRLARHTRTVAWAPADAVWMLVETDSGLLIKSNVVNGASIAAWDASDLDQAVSVRLFDVDRNEIWREEFDVIPPPNIDNVDEAVEAAIEEAAEE